MICSLRSDSETPRLLLLARLMHHATIKALQPVRHEPNIWNRALDQRAAIKTPTDAEGLVHFSSRLLAVCSTVTKMSGVAGDTDARREDLERSERFPRIYLLTKNGKSHVYIKDAALMLSYRDAVDGLSCIINSSARRF